MIDAMKSSVPGRELEPAQIAQPDTREHGINHLDGKGLVCAVEELDERSGATPLRGFRTADFSPTVRLMRLGVVFPLVVVVVAALAAAQLISVDGALASWESLAAKLATVAH